MLRMRVVKETPSWILVDKPAGFHTHPPEDQNIRISSRWNTLAILQRQLGQEIFPMHRLDRATSGLLLFSKDRSLNRVLQEQFAAREAKKRYFALVRGNLVGETRIEQALQGENGSMQEALTEISPYIAFRLPLPHPHGGERTFTVVRADPITGRYHQIRRHLARLGFPIVGDSQHGDRKLNREFMALTGCRSLFLRCMSLEFSNPVSGESVASHAQWGREWHRLFEQAGVCAVTTSPSPRPASLS